MLTQLAVLFLSAFTSATLLPGSSEVVLLGMLSQGAVDPVVLILVASVGNILGSVVNWGIGAFFARFKSRKWFPVSASAHARAEAWFARYGIWSLLLSWVPVIGDPITVVAGVLRVRFWAFLGLVAVSKTARYGFVYWMYFWWEGSSLSF